MPELVQAAGTADKNLVEKWNNKLKACQDARINFEKQWHENLSFYAGRQWIVFTRNPSGGFQLSEQSAQDKWRVRHTANRILRIIRTEITKLSKEEPQWYCVPASTEEKDRLAAMAGEAITEYLMRTKYFNQKRMEATFWACICGTSFLKNYYDESQMELDGQPGKIFFEAVPAFQLFAPNLQVVDIQEQPYVIHARTMDPEAVYRSYGVEIQPETTASTIIESRYLTALGIKQNQNKETKLCYVKENWVKPCRDFPQGAMFVTGENKVLYVYEPMKDPETHPDPMQQMMGGMGQMSLPGMPPEMGIGMPPMGGGGTPSTPPMTPNLGMGMPGMGGMPMMPPSSSQPIVPKNENEESDGEAEIFGPKSDFPGMENYQHEYPFTHGRFPFAKIDHVPTGMFYSESVIKTLIPLQKEYNRTRSIMLENRNLAGKPQWGYITGSIDPKKFNSRPGLLLAVQLGFDFPKALDQPELPSSVVNELEVTTKDMDDASSQFEISKGRTPPGVEAASAIAYLQEENDTIMHHTVVSLEAAVQETGIQVLANVHDFWSQDRIVQMTSKNQFMETKQFKAGDLNPIMDFRVEPGSMAPRSQAAKQAFIIELMKMGVVDPTKALRYLQMNETNKLYDDMMLDTRHAQRENVFMSQGQPLYKPDPTAQQQMDPMTGMPSMEPAYKQEVMRDPMTGEELIDETTGQPQTYNVTVNPYDNHEAHIEEHQSYQKTQEYEMLDPQIQMIIQDHVDEHKQEIMKERNALQTDKALSQRALGSSKASELEMGGGEKSAAPPEEASSGEVPSGNGEVPQEAMNYG